MEDYPFIREFNPPITTKQLRPLGPRCRVIQFRQKLSEHELKMVSEFHSNYPQIPLRLYSFHVNEPDLACLKYFPFIKDFQFDLYETESWDGLQYLPDSLEYLGIGMTRRRFSLNLIRRFKKLKQLHLQDTGAWLLLCF